MISIHATDIANNETDVLKIDIPKNKLIFELNFPGLDPNSIKQSYSFTNTFPPTAANDKAFACSRLINVAHRLREISVTIYLGSNYWRPAKIVFAEIGSDGYKGSVIIDDVFVDKVGVTLKELDFGNPIPFGNDPVERVANAKAAAQVHGYQGSNPYTFFPVYNPYFYGGAPQGEEGYGEGENPDFGGIINDFGAISAAPNSQTFLHNIIPADDSLMNQFTLVPFVYHHYILERIFEGSNVSLNGSFWYDKECRTSIIYNNYPLDYKRRRRYLHVSALPNQANPQNETLVWQKVNFLISSVIDEDADGRFNVANSSYTTNNIGNYLIRIKGRANGFFQLNDPVNGQLRVLISPTAGPSYDEIILSTDQFSFDPTGEFFEGEVLVFIPFTGTEITIEFQNTTNGVITIEWAELSINNLRASELNEFSPVINITNHLPDIQVSTYLNELRKFFGFTFIFDPISRELRLDFVRDFLAANSTAALEIHTSKKINLKLRERKALHYKYDWSTSQDELTEDNFKSLKGLNYLGPTFEVNDPQEGDAILQPHTGSIFIYKQGEFVYYTDYFPDQKYGKANAIQEINLLMTPLLMRIIPYGSSKLTMPAVRQEADSPAFKMDNPLTALRTCFFRGYIQGIAPEPDTRLVPSGSSAATGQWRQSIGETCMSLNDNLTPGLYNQYHRPYVDLMLYSDLLVTKVKLDLAQILALDWKRRWMISGVHLIPVKITFETSPNKISQSEVELYTDFSGIHED